MKKKIVFVFQVNVFVQLYRPGDDSYSDPVPFRYKPTDNYANGSRKRPRIGSAYSAAEIPEVVHRLNAFDSDQEILKHSEFTISTEFDTQKLIQNVLQSAADSTTTHIATQNEQFNTCSMLSENLNSAGMRNERKMLNRMNGTIELIFLFCISELVELLNPLLDMVVFDKLTTDSVSMKQQTNTASSWSMSERFLMQILKKILPVVVSSNSGNDEQQRKKRDFIQEIFKQAYYNGERCVLN